jgi:hypothetical protein
MKNILYFGYGANADPKMMAAIVGRDLDEGREAVLKDFELAIQSWNDIPNEIRNNLAPAWGKSFATYFIRPKNGVRVIGRTWEIKASEISLIDNWEMVDLGWYQKMAVKIGSERVWTQVMTGFDGGEVVSGLKYPRFLNDPVKMLVVANRLRKDNRPLCVA